MVKYFSQRREIDQNQDDQNFDKDPYKQETITQPTQVPTAGFLGAAGKGIAYLGHDNTGMKSGHSQEIQARWVDRQIWQELKQRRREESRSDCPCHHINQEEAGVTQERFDHAQPEKRAHD
jgi:hypothetical protein